MINGISGSSPAGAPVLAAPGGKMGKEEFLRLLVTQLKNQDPLNPTRGEEFAAQLAQFSSLEQLIGINGQLESQAGVAQVILAGVNAQSALGTIGRTVTAIGNGVQVSATGEGQVTFDVGAAGGSATVRVFDATGREVGSRELGEIGPGRHTVELGSASAKLPAGAYTYRVEVQNASGEPVPVNTYTVAKVDGVKYGPNGPMLTSGGLEIPLGMVAQVG